MNLEMGKEGIGFWWGEMGKNALPLMVGGRFGWVGEHKGSDGCKTCKFALNFCGLHLA